MRTLSCFLLVLSLCLPVSADEPTKSAETETLIATAFDEPIYLEQVTPASAEVKREELTHVEYEEWLRKYRGRRVYEMVWHAVLKRYVEREKISVTEEEMAGITAAVERRMKKEEGQQSDNQTFTPEQRKRISIGWSRGSLMDWKVCKSLYEKYGGRVGYGSLGAWTAFDGQNALIKEHYEHDEIQFHDPEMEAAFWDHTKISNFSDVYPKGERLKELLATPPYLWN